MVNWELVLKRARYKAFLFGVPFDDREDVAQSVALRIFLYGYDDKMSIITAVTKSVAVQLWRKNRWELPLLDTDHIDHQAERKLDAAITVLDLEPLLTDENREDIDQHLYGDRSAPTHKSRMFRLRRKLEKGVTP